MRKSKGGDKPKSYKRGKNVPKGPKAPSKRKQNKLASVGGAGIIPTPGKKVKYNKKTQARKPRYSALGEWQIMGDGSTRRVIPAKKSNKEIRPPYSGRSSW